MISKAVLTWPLEGACLVLNPPGHARWAFDIVPLDPVTRRIATGSIWRYLAGRLRPGDVVGWGSSVASPLDGKVIVAHDSEVDHQHLTPWMDVPAAFLVRPLRQGKHVATMAGNHVIIGSPDGYILLAHLRHRSVTVNAGDEVHTGQVLGQLGNSGNTIGPHLHLQVMDGPDPLAARVVPFAVRRYEQWDGERWQSREAAPVSGKRATVRTVQSKSSSIPDSSESQRE